MKHNAVVSGGFFFHIWSEFLLNLRGKRDEQTQYLERSRLSSPKAKQKLCFSQR